MFFPLVTTVNAASLFDRECFVQSRQSTISQFRTPSDLMTYDELHVDGGATSQVFLYPVGIDYEEVLSKLKVPGRPKVYIIRNSRLDPIYEQVENKLFPIAERSLDSLVRTQGIGDLYRIYLQTCRDGLEFNLAYLAARERSPKSRRHPKTCPAALFATHGRRWLACENTLARGALFSIGQV